MSSKEAPILRDVMIVITALLITAIVLALIKTVVAQRITAGDIFNAFLLLAVIVILYPALVLVSWKIVLSKF